MNKIVAKVNKQEIKSKLGHKFLARVLALMEGLNKLNSLWDFLILNDQNDKNRTTTRWTRNFLNAITLSMGLLWEIYKRIEEMKAMNIVVEKPAIRTKIDELLCLFQKPVLLDLLRAYRNQLSFHIDICNICKGIDEIKDDDVEFVVSDTGQVVDSQYLFASDASFSGFLNENERLFLQLLNSTNPPSKLNTTMTGEVLKKLGDYLRDIHFGLIKKLDDEFIPLVISEFNLNLKPDSDSPIESKDTLLNHG